MWVADVHCLTVSLSINWDADRIPPDISFAECLCKGCIINQKENLSYNSVQVFAQMMVMKKTKCDDENYVLKIESLSVPVACTCAVPRSSD